MSVHNLPEPFRAAEMTATEVRLMRYRAAALGALIAVRQPGCAHASEHKRKAAENAHEKRIAEEAERYARAMLATEGT